MPLIASIEFYYDGAIWLIFFWESPVWIAGSGDVVNCKLSDSETWLKVAGAYSSSAASFSFWDLWPSLSSCLLKDVNCPFIFRGCPNFLLFLHEVYCLRFASYCSWSSLMIFSSNNLVLTSSSLLEEKIFLRYSVVKLMPYSCSGIIGGLLRRLPAEAAAPTLDSFFSSVIICSGFYELTFIKELSTAFSYSLIKAACCRS